MKALRTINNYPPGSLQNPTFRYRNASETDISKTFARVRRELARAANEPTAQLALAVGEGSEPSHHKTGTH